MVIHGIIFAAPAPSYVACCVLPNVLCIRHCCFSYCILCTANCLCHGHCCALYMHAVQPYALYHEHCCFMYCICDMLVPQIYCYIVPAGMLLLADVVLVCNSAHGAANDCTDVISLIYILLISH